MSPLSTCMWEISITWNLVFGQKERSSGDEGWIN